MSRNTEKSSKKKKWFLILLILLLLIGSVVTLYVIQSKDDTPENKEPDKIVPDFGNVNDGELDLSNAEELRASLQKEVDDSYMNFKINLSPVFQDGTSSGNVMIQNSEQNKGLLEVEYILSKTGEIIYKTPTLKPNQSIQNDKLLVPLEKGTHDVIASFKTYHLDTYEKLGESRVQIKLNILN